MASVIKSRTSVIVLITAMALVFCFQLGSMMGRTGDEAAASELEQKLAQMDEQNRQNYPDQSSTNTDQSTANTNAAPITSVDRAPIAP